MKKSIGKKILTLVLGIAIVALVIEGAVSLFQTLQIRNVVLNNNDELIGTIAGESTQSMENKVKDELKTLSSGIAEISDEKLTLIQNQTTMIANMAEKLYANPSKYPHMDKGIDYLKEDQVGKFALHIKTSKGVKKSDIQDELNLLQNVSDMLSQVESMNLNIGASYIGTASGFQISADTNPQGPNNHDFPVTERAWYQGAKAAKGVFWTDVYVDFSNRVSITCSVPIYAKNSKGKKVLKGVSASGAMLEEIKNVISDAGVGETGYSYIVDQNGNIIIKDGEMNVKDGVINFENLKDQAENIDDVLKGIKEDKQGVADVKLNGKDVYLAYSPLKTRPWSMVTVIEKSEALKSTNLLKKDIMDKSNATTSTIVGSVRQAILFFVIALLLLVLVIFICSRSFARKMITPIRGLTDSVKEISSGNLQAEIPSVSTGDEIEMLAGAFARMTKALQLQIANIKKITAEKERIGAELNVATQIQADMLPRIFPAFPEREEFDIYASMDPAKEVGGDFYDFFLVDEDHVALVIGDVSGKGVPAALFMVISKTIIKNYSLLGLAPDEVFNRANNELCEGNDAGLFTTAWLGLYEISTGKLVYADAGHDDPMRRKVDGTMELIHPIKKKLVLAGMEGMKYILNEIYLEPGELLLLYTDGVPEATDANNELYGLERLEQSMIAHKDDRPTELLPHLREDVDAFVAGAPQFDDLTMLAIQVDSLGEKK